LRQYYFAKKSQFQAVIREKLCKELSYKKGAHKMLMKLTPWVDFTNIFTESFYCPEPKSAKKTESLIVFFCALCVKAAHIMLVKLTLCVS